MGEDGVQAPRPRRRARRSDAKANQERVLAAAVDAIRRCGAQVPFSTIAADAGVGTATLYRSYPDRHALLSALARRAYDMLIERLEDALDRDEPAIEAIDRFYEWNIVHRDDMVLPLHEGPLELDETSLAQRQRISDLHTRLLERGKREGSVREDVTSVDMIVFGAQLTQRMPTVPDWEIVARRQKRLFIDGLTTPAPVPMPDSSPSIEELRQGYPSYWTRTEPDDGPA